VESSWVLDADQLPRPVGAGAAGDLVLTTREGSSPVGIGYLVRNDGDGFVLDTFLARTPPGDPMRFRLELMPLRFGGARTYLDCPDCGRRVLKLYWPFAGPARFACRGCHGLAYRSSAQRPRSLAELRTFVERRHQALPSPAAAWRRYERIRAAAAVAPTPEKHATV
jgi:hypothetical protein